VNPLLLLIGLLAGPAVDGGAEARAAELPLDAGAFDAQAAAADRPVADAVPDAAPDARSARLRGQVLARGSRNPIVGAKVTARLTADIAATAESDDDGAFDLLLGCGAHTILANAPGYESISLQRDPCSDATPVTVRLVPRSNLPLYETVVTAERDEPSVALRGAEMSSTPGALGDPFRTIESLPGVAAVAWPAPIYAIRGANPGNTGYFLDDLQVPLLFHLALGPSVIHPQFFDSMSFYPGGYPARYGRYIAGAVSAQTRAPAEDRRHAQAEVRLYDAGALVASPWPDKNGGAAVAFRYSYTGALISLLQEKVHLSYWDYQVRADRRTRGWALALFVFGSSDDLSGPGTNLADRGAGKYVAEFHRVSLRASRAAGKGRVSIHVALGRDSSTAPIAATYTSQYTVTERAMSIIPRVSYQRAGSSVDFEAGADGQAQWLRPSATVNLPGFSDLAHPRNALLFGCYASSVLRAGSRFSVTPALRFDSYTIGDTSKADLGPRLSARLRVGGKTWLSANGGRFSQAPSLAIQFPAAENFGLGLYGLQTSWQAALGIETHDVPGIQIEATGYLQRYVLTDLRDPGLIRVDPLARDFLVRRDARSYGVEILLRRPFTERLHGWIAYTLSQSQRALGSGVIGPSDWDQRHILNAVLGYRLGPYTFGARWHFNTGRPVLIVGGQADTFVRLPGFYQLDVRAERTFLFNAFTLHVYLEVVNSTLTRETYALSQELDGTVSSYTIRIFLPSLGVRGEL
jgi:hypothetical protein